MNHDDIEEAIADLRTRVTNLEINVHGDEAAIREYEKGNFPRAEPNRGLWHDVRDLVAMKVQLFGDKKAHAAWEAARKYDSLGIAPAAPDLGVIARVLEMIEKQDKLSNAMEATMMFGQKLQAFFGPMMANKNPPLDGNQIASQDYVDSAVGRFAGAIRNELSEAMMRVAAIDSVAEAIGKATDDLRAELLLKIGKAPAPKASGFASKLRDVATVLLANDKDVSK